MAQIIIEPWTRRDMKRVKYAESNVLNSDVRYIGLCGGWLCAEAADGAVYAFKKCCREIVVGGSVIEVDERIYTTPRRRVSGGATPLHAPLKRQL